MNELDQFVKHKLRIKFYFRYCDDFIILSKDRRTLETDLTLIEKFLYDHLKLRLHENKVSIKKLSQGIDFLGYVVLPRHCLLRTKTKRRMLKRINSKNLTSYLGILKHCKGKSLEKKITLIAGLNNGK